MADFSTIITADGNIICKRADTFDLTVEFFHVDDDSPHDLSQYDTLTAHIKNDAKDPTFLLEFSVGQGFTVSGNRLQWRKESTEMLLESKGYVYDIEADKGGIITTIGSGNFTVVADVTRAADTPR